jgi:metalloendopeptidase OMA1, mitochondrial
MKSVLASTLAAIILLSVIFSACYTNPITHRRELMAVSPQDEANLGFSAFADLKKTTAMSSDPGQIDLVRRVGQRISSVVDLPYAQWEFVVFAEPQTANAFCMPGGKVGVYSGILPITLDENGLATVIGHEVSHAVARHGGERMSQAMAVQFGGMTLQTLMQQKPQETQALALQIYGAAANVGYELPFSRTQEYEADYMGLLTMAKAGYDPRQAVSFWQRFKAWSDQQGSAPIEFLSTHPLDQNRINALQKHMPEALAIYNGRR